MKRQIMMVRLEPKLVGITWQQATDADVWETYTLKSIEHPTPELKKGMQAMLPTALRLLELPSEYGGNCSVRAIQYDTIGDELAFAVHVVKQLGEGNGGRLVVIKTPMAMSVAGSVVRCTEKDIERAEEVQNLAESYLDGDRAQDDLFPAGKDATGSIGDGGLDMGTSSIGKKADLPPAAAKKAPKSKGKVKVKKAGAKG